MSLLPKISVVMPAYNVAPFVERAVMSILDQSFGDFEFIIVNDGSADETPSILAKFAALDDRVRLVHQPNRGMIAALNRGCSMSRGDYIARMDADDISHPDRLAKQLTFLEDHPDIGILGTWIRKLRNNVAEDAWCPPIRPGVLRWQLLFGVNVAHPSILIRKKIAEQLGFYRPAAVHAEDVDLWFRASTVTEFANLPEILYDYRVGHGSISQTDQAVRQRTHVRFLREYVRREFALDAPLEAIAGLRQTRVGPRFHDLRQIRLTASLVQTLCEQFVIKNRLSAEDRAEITWDAASRVASLALQASHLDFRSSFSFFTQAVKLDYRLLSPAVILKGLDRVWQR